MMKFFFKTLRLVLLPFMLLWAKFGAPKGIVRAAEEQKAVEMACANLALYYFKTCPFCIKVRHEMARLSLPIELRDAQHEATHREALLSGGGKVQAPCLRVVDQDGSVQWTYESSAIISYLQQRFS